MISDRENTLRAIEFRHPEWIPIDFDLMGSVKFRHGVRLAEMMSRHPLPFASPDEIDAQIREIVEKVGRPEGGLMLYACPSADVPLVNIEAICTGWERYGAPGA